ncbi:PHP domain-containing protein [Lampropedia puyangensis]|uniref:PHP domain-containing protein n=1 Tax=Lampropedia puyangensis TaxID=1330072 RepID=A0A4S8EVB9_9BURK|nr:PHP domain-containing protein [Lampropedia puyangensis]THT98456.1 PHP domain-containing protein [Lampropedia puyangensis]
MIREDNAVDALNADLHCHSTASDGVLTPAELAVRAKTNGVQLWSLTDHDTLAGQAQAAEVAADLRLPYVHGVELSVLFAGRTLHVVALRFDPSNTAFQSLVDANRALRDDRAQQMAYRLEQAGFQNAFEGALQMAGSRANLTRPHFARYLVESGQAQSVQDVFEHYLGDGKRCYVPTEWVAMSMAISAVREAGGVAVLAHPLAYHLRDWELDILALHFKQLGGEAIEVVSGARLSEAEMQRLAALASSLQLMGSRGSDFHLPIEGSGDLGHLPPLPKQALPVWNAWKE